VAELDKEFTALAKRMKKAAKMAKSKIDENGEPRFTNEKLKQMKEELLKLATPEGDE